MRIVKLSAYELGFETIEACTAYFEHVVPWQKGIFIMGEGHIASDGLKKDEVILFSYSGSIVCCAKAEKLIKENNKAIAVKVNEKTKKIFHNPPSLIELEKLLQSLGYPQQVYGVQGWNIIEAKYEPAVIDFLMKCEWKDYL